MFGLIRSRLLTHSIGISNQFMRVPACYFSGHSHWATIKHDKADKDIKRSSLYAKLSKSISCAVQQGGPDPTKNLKLEAAISAAKAASMPKENIERAINGKSVDASKMQFITYEGFGPGSCAIIVECLTDNKKRTVSEIRHIFTKGMGRLGTIGSASFLFKYTGTLTFPKNENQERIFDLALEAGADDVVENEDENTVVVQCAPTQLHAMKEAFAKEKLEGKMELSYLPTETVVVDDPVKQENITWILQQLDDHPDVQNVFHNLA